MKIAGSVAVVTGAGSGLGRASAAMLLEQGANVALIDRDAARLAEAAASFPNPQAIATHGLDVADGEAATAVIDAVAARFGPPRILVNCAGIAPAAKVLGKKGPHDLALFQEVLRVNLFGSFNMMRLVAAKAAAAPALADGERGVIVNTASIAAYEGQIGQAAYAASKGAVASMTLPAARELAPLGVRVVAIAPGLFATPMLLSMPQEVQDNLAASVPFPQRLGDPSEYAETVRHIVENPMLNGSVIRLDGALRMAAR